MAQWREDSSPHCARCSLPGAGKPLLCAIESAKGVANAFRIAEEPSVTHLALGGIDLQKDLRVANAGATSSAQPPTKCVGRGRFSRCLPNRTEIPCACPAGNSSTARSLIERATSCISPSQRHRRSN
jgi:citrate lyase beta subunit